MIILDNWALCDPLLARLPAYNLRRHWRPIPEGYLLSRRTGDLSKMNPDLALYYGKLWLIVSGGLWDSERLEEIIKFNSGAYDEARERYLESTLVPVTP